MSQDGIFLSYRRDDSQGEALHLFSDLKKAFGSQHVFMDVVGIEPGSDFRKVIDAAVSRCDVLLVMMGKKWLDSTDDSGRRRLDDPDDFVRTETASALQREIPVVPVLVQGAVIPHAADLPDDLKALAGRNAFEIRHTRWDDDVASLTTALRRTIKATRQSHSSKARLASIAVGENRWQPRKSWRPVALFLMVLVAGIIYWDAFQREHVEYYANVITRGGLPEGVGLLNEEQVRHRNISLKFTRHGRWGTPPHEVRMVNSRDTYPPAFAYFPSPSLVDLNPLADSASGMNSEILSLCRVTFDFDADGRILKQIGYNPILST